MAYSMTFTSAHPQKLRSVDPGRPAEPAPWYWTRDQYYALGEGGWFKGQPVELIRGRIIEMPPMGIDHARVCTLVRNALQRIFEPDHWVREDKPISIAPDSEPQPDVSVAEHPLEHYTTEHPKTALLVVEVSASTLRYDRSVAGLYASAGIPDFWIINLVDSVIELHRSPVADAASEFGYRYSQVTTLHKGESVAPLARPDAQIAVNQLLR